MPKLPDIEKELAALPDLRGTGGTVGSEGPGLR